MSELEHETQDQQPTEPEGAAYKLADASQVIKLEQLELRRYHNDGLWLFGAVVDGVFLPFGQAKLGYIDTELAEAANPGHKQRVYETYRRDVLGQ